MPDTIILIKSHYGVSSKAAGLPTGEEQRKACRETWLRNVPYPYFFLLGLRSTPGLFGYQKWAPPYGETDTHTVHAPDQFQSIAPKLVLGLRWALEKGAQRLFLCDDDTFVRTGDLTPPQADYEGFRHQDNDGTYYVQGSAYWLSRRAAEVLIESPHMRAGIPDDVAVGRALSTESGLIFRHNYRYWPGAIPKPAGSKGWITNHKCGPEEMRAQYAALQ